MTAHLRDTVAVSYTHLDVYKRQTQPVKFINEGGSSFNIYGLANTTYILALTTPGSYNGAPVLWKVSNNQNNQLWVLNSVYTVSYTHLDVYKRQSMRFTVNDLSSFPMKDEDVVTLLGNLLDLSLIHI